MTPARSDTIAACERQSGKEENEMKACVICAMKEEAEAVAAVLSDRKEFHWAHGDGFRGVIAGHDVTVTVSGIGKVAAAVSAVLTIKEENPDIVINSGSAGALSKDLRIGDAVVSTEVAYHDADLTVFGYKPGQMAGCKPRFTSDVRLVKAALRAALPGRSVRSGLIVSGDQFLSTDSQKERILSIYPDALMGEMEGAAIAHACTILNVPFLIVRSASDSANGESPVKFEEFLPTASENAAIITRTVLESI